MITLGVSSCFLYPDPERGVYSAKTLSYIESDMARYLTRHDVLPILLPDAGDALEQYLDLVDGLVFQGGTDLAPSTYGEAGLQGGRWPGDPVRDRYELDLMDRAARRRMPVFGICRGAQLLNVWCGGTLYQDIELQLGSGGVHRDPARYDRVRHDVSLVEGGVLSALYDADTLSVNSIHHQGIKTLGAGLVAEATSPEDGLVEAFTSADMDAQYLLAVQWHPEFSHTLGEQVDSPAPLLDHFLKAVRTRRA